MKLNNFLLKLSLVLFLILAVLGYFIYGGGVGVFVVLSLIVSFIIISIFANVPYIGFILQGILMYHVSKSIASYTNVEEITFITVVLMLMFIFSGFFITLKTTKSFHLFRREDLEEEKIVTITPKILEGLSESQEELKDE